VPISEGQRMLARNVWRLREARRMSASKLADRLSWPLIAVEELERAEKLDISLAEIDQLASALAVQPYELFVASVH
jgi:transcriptional regulator with XRE-family HTH domain